MTLLQLLRLAREKDASDVHLAVGAPPVLRVHGKLTPLDEPPVTPETFRAEMNSLLTEEQWVQFEAQRDFELTTEIASVGRVRVSLSFQRLGEAAVLHLIRTAVSVPTELELPPVVEDLARREEGLILVTGPSGSGRTTTLAALVELINRERAAYIVTIEQPIEYIYEPKRSFILQREVGTHTQSFAAAVYHARRSDADVLLVSELPDRETSEQVLIAATAGQLVLTALPTRRAVQTIEHLLGLFPAEQRTQRQEQLANVLQGIISQHLLPTTDGGYVAAAEIMVATETIRQLIRKGRLSQIPSVIQTAHREGMQSLEQSLKNLVMTGRVAPEVAQEALGG